MKRPSDGQIAIVEDDLAGEGDPDYAGGRPDRLATDRADAAVIERRVVHRIELSSGLAEQLPPFLRRSASGYPTIAVCVPRPLSTCVREKRWTPDILTELRENAFAIVVSAFDDEGWLVWERRAAGDPVPR